MTTRKPFGFTKSRPNNLILINEIEIVGEITNIETIAVGTSIRVLPVLNKKYGKGRWRKKKGTATVKLKDGTFRAWYERHGIGKRDMKIKFPFLD